MRTARTPAFRWRRLALRVAFAFAAGGAAAPALADLFVVVPATSPVHAMSQKEVVDLYMGRSRAFPGGDIALPFDLPRDNPGHAAFYLALTGMGQAQINSYWSRLMFSGQ